MSLVGTIGPIVVAVILAGVLLAFTEKLSFNDTVRTEEPFTKCSKEPEVQINLKELIEQAITTMNLFPNSVMYQHPTKTLRILQDFNAWLDKNPDSVEGLRIDPRMVVNTYFRQSNPDNPLKVIKTDENAELLNNTLHRIESMATNQKEGFQSYIPQRLQEFDAWLEDDFPRRKRFDIAMKGSNDMPTKIVVTQIINEFVSTNQIPASESKELRKNVLSYLQFNTTIPNYKQTYNTTNYERLRIILKDNPDAPFAVKFKHYANIYKDDPLGKELNDYFEWLVDSNLIIEEKDVAQLQKHLKKTLEMYPKQTDVLKKAITEQFIANLNIVEN